MLNVSDTNNLIKQTIEPFLLNLPSSVDGYGIEMVTNMMSVSSNSNGIANFTDIGITTMLILLFVSCQGTIGSLSNYQSANASGAGVFTITLPVETTKAGQLELNSVSLTYTSVLQILLYRRHQFYSHNL